MRGERSGALHKAGFNGHLGMVELLYGLGIPEEEARVRAFDGAAPSVAQRPLNPNSEDGVQLFRLAAHGHGDLPRFAPAKNLISYGFWKSRLLSMGGVLQDKMMRMKHGHVFAHEKIVSCVPLL